MFRFLIALLITFQLAACSKSSSPEDGSILTGQLMATGVEGLTYTTASQSGFTDSNGIFKYRAGESITFAVGNLPLAQNVPAKEFMTLLDFDTSQNTTLVAGTIEDGFTLHTVAENTVAASNVVSNITRFLENLDDNKKADDKNGIRIWDTTAETATNKDKQFLIRNLNKALESLPADLTIDFNISPDEFGKAPTKAVVSTTTSNSITVIDSTNASWANILLDRTCFAKAIPANEDAVDIGYGEIKDKDKNVTTDPTILYPQTREQLECLDPATIQKALTENVDGGPESELSLKNTADAAVVTKNTAVTDKEKEIENAPGLNKTAEEIKVLQADLLTLKEELVILQATQKIQKDRVLELQNMINTIANGRRRINEITIDNAKTYLTEQSGIFTSTVSERIALSPFAFRYPASDTSVKSIVVFPVSGTKTLQDMEVKSLNENIVSISGFNSENKTVEFFATGNAGEETEIVINFRLSGDYKWFRKTTRIILQ